MIVFLPGVRHNATSDSRNIFAREQFKWNKVINAADRLHRPTKFYDQNVTGQWAHVSGLIFQADF